MRRYLIVGLAVALVASTALFMPAAAQTADPETQETVTPSSDSWVETTQTTGSGVLALTHLGDGAYRMRTFLGKAPSSSDMEELEMRLNQAGGGRVFFSNVDYAGEAVADPVRRRQQPIRKRTQ